MDTKKNQLTIVIGLPRAGKSTWIDLNKGDDVVVSNDWIRENILGEKYSYSEAANSIVWTITDATLRIVLGQGKSAILDGVNLTRSTRKFFVDIARQYNARVRMVLVETLFAVCAMRNRTATGHKLPEAKLEAMFMSLERPTDDEYQEFVVVQGGKQ